MIYRTREADTDTPSFVLNRESTAAKASLIIFDECSMVDEELGRDLLSFDTPVLVLGDPAQLPPVKGGGSSRRPNPDAMLTEVHRQAADNPIIALSMQVREGGPAEGGDLWREPGHPAQRSRRRRRDAGRPAPRRHNRSRKAFNRRMRELLGFSHDMPEVGEKARLPSQRQEEGPVEWRDLRRGDAASDARQKLKMSLVPEEDRSRKAVKVSVLPAFFEGREEDLARWCAATPTSSTTAMP